MDQRGTGRLRTGRGRVGAPVGTAGVSRAAGEEALLVDEMFSPLIAALLREDGHDALAVADHPVRATASDPYLAQWASQEACRVVRERPRLRRACRRRRSCAATAVHQLAAVPLLASKPRTIGRRLTPLAHSTWGAPRRGVGALRPEASRRCFPTSRPRHRPGVLPTAWRRAPQKAAIAGHPAVPVPAAPRTRLQMAVVAGPLFPSVPSFTALAGPVRSTSRGSQRGQPHEMGSPSR